MSPPPPPPPPLPASPWSSELGRFLGTLRETQDDLLGTMQEKSLALRELDEPRLAQILALEETQTRKLRSLLQVREQVLASARGRGWSVASIGELVARLPNSDRTVLEPKLSAVRDAARRLRHESWSQWVVAHRSTQHATELLALVAGGGSVDPVYDRNSRFGQPPRDSVVPAMLDAEV